MQGFLILTPFVGCEMMQRGICTGDAITSCEVNAKNHCHLQASCQIVSKAILDRLFEVLQVNCAFISSVFGQGHLVLTIHQSSKVEDALPKAMIPCILIES